MVFPITARFFLSFKLITYLKNNLRAYLQRPSLVTKLPIIKKNTNQKHKTKNDKTKRAKNIHFTNLRWALAASMDSYLQSEFENVSLEKTEQQLVQNIIIKLQKVFAKLGAKCDIMRDRRQTTVEPNKLIP